MSDNNNPQTPGTFHSDPTRPRGLGRKLFWAFLIVGGVLVISRSLTAYRPFGHRGHWGATGSSPDEIAERWTQRTDWILKRLDATAAQRNQIQSIQANLMPDVQAFENEREALHNRLRLALASNPLDRAELERIRTASLDLADRASRRTVDSFGQMLDVLTPEQREELLDHWGQRQ